MMCGGTSDAKPADAEIQAIINEVKLNNIYYSCVHKIYGGKIKAYSYEYRRIISDQSGGGGLGLGLTTDTGPSLTV